jgi:uncharacterized protein (TIGR03437 family)
MRELRPTLQGWFYGALFVAIPLLAQRPAISPGGVVDAASLMPVDRPAHGVAPGSIASIFGQNLAPSAAQAESYPLPKTLNGTTVTVDGAVAPLFYVSPTQINFQVPSSAGAPLGLSVYSKVTVEVSTQAGRVSASVDLYYREFGIFTLDGSGCGRGAVLNVNPDGTMSLNSPSNSASPGSYLALFGTGLGPVTNPPPDGVPAASSPLSVSQVYPPGPSVFAARAPGMAGVDQVNLLVSSKWQEGCAVPVGFAGATIPVSIHSGGGQCVDPPSNSLGQILLKKSVVLNDNTIPESDSLVAFFAASPYAQLASPPVKSSDQLAAQATAVCPPPGYTVLDAGTITLAGPGGIRAETRLSGSRGNTGYQLNLPPGSVQPGTYAISSPGGRDVGGFQMSLDLPADIQITSDFPRGTQIITTGTPESVQPLTVTWTGGAAGQLVTVKMIEHRAGDGDEVSMVQAPATSGSVSFERSCTITPSTRICRLTFGGAAPMRNWSWNSARTLPPCPHFRRRVSRWAA